MNELRFTGERYIPGTRGEIWVEHWHRYHFARRWVAGRSVLDVACGEGYGSALLARDAAQVTGVDVSAEAIAHARREYAPVNNASFECAPCTRLPLADASIDVAVSFETLEHIAEQDAFLDELARVLRPEGLLILSCPNRLEYRDRRNFENPFHVKELYRDELARIVDARFAHCTWYGQRPSFFSVIAPEDAARPAGQLVEVEEKDPARDSPRLANPLYFVLVASRQADALAAAPATLSVLADRGDWVHRDYEKVMRDLEVTVDRGLALERQVADRERSVGALQEEVRSLQHAGEELREALANREAALSQSAAAVALRDEAIATREREILRRRGWRWWLKLPLVRLGLLDDERRG
jgi:ubiquinone/menaquinone biosynthesis C-methylase UbiE